jgi:AcrR family transcriptional regulator
MGASETATAQPVEQARDLGGRPRDPALDDRILEVVRTLLAERGYQALSVQEVTRRSSVHVRTINRRWATKGQLVAAAILGADEPITPDDSLPSGDLTRDFEQIVRGTLDYLSDPAVRAAMPALWAEMHTDAGLRDLIDVRRTQLTELVQAILEAAVASGSAPPNVVKQANVVATLLAGASFAIQSTSFEVLDDAAVSQMVALLKAGLFALDQ